MKVSDLIESVVTLSEKFGSDRYTDPNYDGFGKRTELQRCLDIAADEGYDPEECYRKTSYKGGSSKGQSNQKPEFKLVRLHYFNIYDSSATKEEKEVAEKSALGSGLKKDKKSDWFIGEYNTSGAPFKSKLETIKQKFAAFNKGKLRVAELEK